MYLLFVADSLEAFKTAKDTTFSILPDIVTPTLGSGLAPWRDKLFAQIPLRRGGGGVPRPAQQRGGGAGVEGGNLIGWFRVCSASSA